VFKIQGELHHQIGSLLPSDEKPVYAQLYIIDPHEALNHRMNGGLDPDVMYRLGGLISENHRWAGIFRRAHEVFQTSRTDIKSCHFSTHSFVPTNSGHVNNSWYTNL